MKTTFIQKISKFFTIKKLLIIALLFLIIAVSLVTIKILNHNDIDSVVSELSQNVYGDNDGSKSRYKFNKDYSWKKYYINEDESSYEGTFKIKETLFGKLNVELIEENGIHMENGTIALDKKGKINQVTMWGIDLHIISEEELAKDEQEIQALKNKSKEKTKSYISGNSSRSYKDNILISDIKKESKKSGDEYYNNIKGTITNNTDSTYSYIKLKITLYNSSNQIIGVEYTFADSDEIPNGAKSTFYKSLFTNEKVNEVKVEVDSTTVK